MKYIDIAVDYLAITDKYDAGRDYKWEKAYEELRLLSAKANRVRRNTRSRETFLITDLLVREIDSECKRVHDLYEQEYDLNIR